MSRPRDGVPMRRRTGTLAGAAGCLREQALPALAKIVADGDPRISIGFGRATTSRGAVPLTAKEVARHLVRQIASIIDLAAVVETGTFRGTTTEFLWHVGACGSSRRDPTALSPFCSTAVL
jgi:hypothetical protein